VANAAALPVGRLISVDLLDHPVLLWRTDSGIHAWRDRCPHRGTRLSLGAIRGGDTVVCPYHGWQFGSDGRCVAIPADGRPVISDRIRVQAYNATQQHGLIWVNPGDGAQSVPTLIGFDQRYRSIACGPFDVATSAPRLIENFIDLSHFPFVHAGYLGEEPHTAVARYRVEVTPSGVTATQCRTYQPRANAASGAGAEVYYRYWVLTPMTALLHKSASPEDPPSDIIMMSVQPISEERSRVWMVLAMDYCLEQPDSFFVNFQETIFGQDCSIVESQQPKRLPLTAADECHQRADLLSHGYRKWLRQLGATYGTC